MNRTLAAITIIVASHSPAADAAVGKQAVVAVLVAPGEHAERASDVAAALEALITEEPGLVPAERGSLDALLAEQKLRFTGLADARTCARTGELLQADFMVSVAASKEGVAFRIVETPTAKVLAESEGERLDDVFLTARMIFEKLVGAVKRAPKLSDRLTVGIGAIYNESGTDRSDKLGEELAECIRHYLRREGWAIVLERQYPEPLLAELGLARSGLAESKVVAVPQADVVIAGSLIEETRQFARGLDYPVAFKITVASGRKGGTRYEFELRGRSNDVDAVAREVVKRARLHRRSLTVVRAAGATGEDEMARLWRAARLLVPGPPNQRLSDGTFVQYPYVRTDRDRTDMRAAIRLLENVLLVDQDHNDAKMLLGRCLIAMYVGKANQWNARPAQRQRARGQCDRAVDLVYTAVQRDPSERSTTAFYVAAGRIAYYRFQPQGDRLIGFILANQKMFTERQVREARSRMARLHKEKVFDDFRQAAQERDITRAFNLTTYILNARGLRDEWGNVLSLARTEALSNDPHVAFWAERLVGLVLLEKNDPSAVDHLLRAVELKDEALAELRKVKNMTSCSPIGGICKMAYDACGRFGMHEKGRKVLEDAVQPVFSGAVEYSAAECAPLLAEVYAREGRADEGLRVCEKVLRWFSAGHQLKGRGRLIELREMLKAAKRGEKLPCLDELVKLCGDGDSCSGAQLLSADGRIWAVLSAYGRDGPIYHVDANSGVVGRPRGVGLGTGVAVVGGRTFLSTRNKGMLVLDRSAQVVSRLTAEKGELPSDHIGLLTSTGTGPGDAVYLAFNASQRSVLGVDDHRQGIARLDPRTLGVTVLSPSRRDVDPKREPVAFISNIVWSPDERVLWVGCWYWVQAYQQVGHEDLFSYRDAAWTSLGSQKGPTFRAVCDGRTLHVSAKRHRQHRGLRTVTMKLHPDDILLRSDDPLLLTARDAVWDARRLWLATYAGLYEVDRATGEMRCIAHKDKTPVFALLKHGGWLYAGARDGIYRYRIP